MSALEFIYGRHLAMYSKKRRPPNTLKKYTTKCNMLTVNVTKRTRCELIFPQFFPGELQNKINPKSRFTVDDIKLHIFVSFIYNRKHKKGEEGCLFV